MTKTILISIAAGILACAGGFGARLYVEGGLPTSIIQKALTSVAAVKSQQYQGNFSATVSGTSTPEGFTIQFEGGNDAIVPTQSKGQLSLSMNIKQIPELSQLVGDGFLKFDIRYLEKVIYFRLTAIPATPLVNFAPILNQWISFPASQLGEQAQSQAGIAGGTATAEQLTELRNDFISSNIFRFTALLPESSIDGQQMHRYAFIVDRERLIAFIPHALAWEARISGEPTDAVTQKRADELVASLRKTAINEYPTGELTIGRTDGMLHRFTIRKTINTSEYSQARPALDVVLSFDVSMNNFNEAIAVDKPTNSISAKEAFDRVLNETNKPAATVSYAEITQWVGALPSAAQADLAAATALTNLKYEKKPPTKEQYETYDRCINYIVSVAIKNITAGDLAALRKKPNAMQALSFDEKRTDAQLRSDLLLSLQNEYIMPDIINRVGSSVVLSVDSVMGGTYVEGAPIISKSSCASLPVAAKYK